MEQSPQEPARPPQESPGNEPAQEGDFVEIHPPHGSIRSFGDFLLQLITITAGVLMRCLAKRRPNRCARTHGVLRGAGVSRLYGVEELYADHQRRTLEKMAAALAFLADGPPHLAAPRDLEMFRQQVLALRADLVIEEQIGRRLTDIYGKTLEQQAQ